MLISQNSTLTIQVVLNVLKISVVAFKMSIVAFFPHKMRDVFTIFSDCILNYTYKR